jgi:hypothetical protein
LQHLFILVNRVVFDDNDVITLTDFAMLILLGFSLPLLLSLKSRKGGWDGDVLLHIVLHMKQA